MNGVHDLGGMHGFGPIDLGESGQAIFHAEWEARARAIAELAVEFYSFNVDAFRHGIELMDPAHYLRSYYFERWLTTTVHNLIAHGVLTAEELDARTELLSRNPDATFSPGVSVPREQSETHTETEPPATPTPPRFGVGDVVVTRNEHPHGHTRLPRYARGKRGVVHIVHQPEVLPDLNAHGLGEHQQAVYNVRFDGRELWGQSAEPGQTVSLDLWESYLEPAPA